MSLRTQNCLGQERRMMTIRFLSSGENAPPFTYCSPALFLLLAISLLGLGFSRNSSIRSTFKRCNPPISHWMQTEGGVCLRQLDENAIHPPHTIGDPLTHWLTATTIQKLANGSKSTRKEREERGRPLFASWDPPHYHSTDGLPRAWKFWLALWNDQSQHEK